MHFRSKTSRPLAIASVLLFATAGLAAIAVRIDDSVPSPNPRTGSPDNVIIDDYQLTKIAEGTDPLENPSGPITTFGFLNATPIINGTKTEPDENLYVVFGSNPGGPTANFNYGHHFLYQGHENSGGLAYVTRINLDVTNDPAHRITLLTPVNAQNQTGLSSIDGSTFDPFSQTLLFTQENAATKGVIEISAGWPATIRTLEGFIGTGGFEGIHPDGRGDLLIVEDVSGTAVNVIPNNASSPKTAHQPNSFVYRYRPYNPANLAGGGTLYALQVWIDGQTLTFHANDPVGDTFADVQVKLRKRGAEWGAMWVQIHDTNANGSASFSANAAAKAAGATPFKRPENAQFQPGTDFDTFYFVETGDTDADAGNQQALADRGAWGSIFRVNFDHNRQWGVISNVLLGDAEHASFDNVAFADQCTLLTAEDRGDGLHEQLGFLDSVWAFQVCNANGKNDNGKDDKLPGDHRRPKASRLIALGRDTLGTAAVLAGGDGDNEPTGLHVSDGSTTIAGLLGRQLDPETTRWFVTQQHGKNQVFEIVINPNDRDHHR
jgi:hypothetical protein